MAGEQSSKSLLDEHPFGEEEDVSKRQLFVALCNHLQLGQWELARACIFSLHAEREQIIGSDLPAVDDLLKALAENPYKTCFGSDSLPSPVHLSWHCSQLLQTLTQSENLLPEDFQYKAEFLMLLLKVHAESSPPVLQELFLFFIELLNEKHHPGSLRYKPSLSRQALQFIQKTLSQNPNLGHSLVSQLLLPGNPTFQTSNQSLQKLYSVCIKDILAEIRKDIANSKVGTANFSSRLDNFLSLLSRWNPAQQTMDNQLERIFSEVLEILPKIGEESLHLRAQSSLLGRDSTHMPLLYNSVNCQRVFQIIDDDVAQGRGGLRGNTQQTRVLVGLSLKEDRQKAWENYLSLVLKNNGHILGQIIETSLAFIQDGLFEELSVFLQPLEFQPLKPVILLVGWNYVSSSTSAENLIEALCLSQIQCRDPLLNEACTKLSAQVASMRWCLETVRPLLPSPSHQSALEARASRMFQDLNSYSILSMLHRLTGLGQLDKDVVFKLLKTTPPIENKGSKAKTEQSKSVHFADEDTSLKPEQGRDVSIYSSFLVMKHFLEALLATVPHSPKLPGNETDATSDMQFTNSDSHWEHFVEERLRWVEEGMSSMYPLSYRVEILENLFSLLFLRYEDLIDGKDLTADSDEEEGLIEDDLTNLSITSLESISSPLRDIPFNQILDSRQEQGKVTKKIDFGEGTMGNSLGESRADGVTFEKEMSPETAVAAKPADSEVSLDSVRRREFIQGSSNQEREIGETQPPFEGNTGSHVSTESISQQSHISSIQTGFIASDATTRKLLMTLKKCLGDISKEKMALYGISAYNTAPHEKDGLLRYLDTSVPLPQLAQRIATLTQCINEAWWRYQLVSEGSVTKGSKGDEDEWSSDEDMDRLADVLVLDMSYVKSNKTKNRKRRSKNKSASGVSSSGRESGSQSALSQLSADNRVSADGAQNGNGRSRGHRKRRRRVRSDSQPLSVSHDRSTVARMLATGDTLLKMCLRKGNYSQASQVVKMFGMDDNPDAVEVQFSQKWERAVQQLQALEGTIRTDQQRIKQFALSSSRRSKVIGIASMAAAGMMSTSVTGIIDMLLTSSDLPSLPKLQDLSVWETASSLERTIYDHFQRLNIPVMIILDLACSFCHSRQSSQDLLEMAIGRVQKVKEQVSAGDSPKEDGHSQMILGVSSFLQQLHQLMNLSPTALVQESKQSVSSKTTLSARDILTEGGQPLTPSAYQTSQKRSSDLSSRISRLESLILDKSNEQLEVMQMAVEGSSTGGSETVQKVSGHLLQLLDRATGMMYTSNTRRKEEEGSSQQGINYFLSIFKHACILASLQLEAQDWHPDHDKELKGGVFNACNPFIVFHQSPSVLLGQMMFQNKIPPIRLEDVADKLKLNLVKIIIQSCCPTIPVSPHLPSLCQPSRKSHEAFIYKPRSGVYVLNETAGVQDENITVRHPVLVARELLTRMVTFVKSQCVNMQDPNLFDLQSAAKASCHPEFHSIQIACQELLYVDLTLLTSNLEKTCFFTNVLNLMLVHAALHHVYDQIMSKQKKKLFTPSHTRHRSLTGHPVPSVEGIKPPTSHTSMTLDLLTHLCKYSYRIGQMGVVSAFDLEFVILRHRLPAPSVFSHILSDRLVDIHVSDPWYKFLPAADTRLVFVITNGCISSPTLTVLHEDDMEEQLDLLMQQYLESTIEVDDVRNEVTIPQLLEWFRRDFTGRRLSSQTVQGEVYAGLLNVLGPHVSPRLAGKLERYTLRFQPGKIEVFSSDEGSPGSNPTETKSTLIRQKSFQFKVHVDPFNHDFGYSFATSGTKKLTRNKRRLSTPDIQNGKDNGLFAIGRTSSVHSRFRMTESTMRYLQSKSDLFAVLAGVCSQAVEDKDASKDTDFTVSTSAESAKSLVFEETFGSERIFEEGGTKSELDRVLMASNAFPTLQRHIRTFFSNILPVAVSLETMENASFSPGQPLNIENIQACILANQNSVEFQNVVYHALEKLVLARKWDEATQLIENMSGFEESLKSNYQIMRDFVLCCASQRPAPPSPDSKRVGIHWKLLLGITNESLQVHMVFSLLEKLPGHACIQLLELVLARATGPDHVKEAISHQLEEIKIYEKIAEYANEQGPLKDHQVTDAGCGVSIGDLQRTDWQDVCQDTRQNPRTTLNTILCANDFELAKKWAVHHGKMEEFCEDIHRKHLEYCLSDPVNETQACQILESLESSEQVASLGRTLLETSDEISLEGIVILVQYLMRRCAQTFHTTIMEEFQALLIGAKALLCLPETVRSDYSHLKSQPELIFEQLLMNMKVEWASKVHSLLLKELESTIYTLPSVSVQSIKAMIIHYARAAVYVAVVEPSDMGTSTLQRSMTAASLMSLSHITTPAATAGRGRPYRLSSSLSPSSIPVPKKSSDSDKVSHSLVCHGRCSTKRGTLKICPLGLQPPGIVKLDNTPHGSETSKHIVPGRDRSLPLTPPKKEDWVPDASVTHCMNCQTEKFSMLNRRHHCRRCGRVVCWRCSQLKAVVQGYGETPVRICDECYRAFIMPRPKGGKLSSTPHSLENRLGGLKSGGSPRVTPSPILAESRSRSGTPASFEPDQGDLMAPQYLQDMEWKLSVDKNENKTIREDFYYDKAPNTSLCLSILDLHNDPFECGGLLLQFVETLSEKLRPIRPGVPNPEVDHSLIISMMRTLLFSAKLKFAHGEESSMVEKCDTYLSRVDLLKLFVANNCADIPSIQELAQSEKARNVRDRLVKSERLSLAMEVSTKCGLDTSAVWSAWGSSCLRAGAYEMARSKFSRVLKPVSDRNVCQPLPKLLNDIIDFLESSSAQTIKTQDILDASRSSIKDFIAVPRKDSSSKKTLESPEAKECLFYINTYCPHLTAIQFYIRHNLVSVALHYLIKNNCSGEVFLEGLFLPCLKKGQITTLEEHMLQLDPTLNTWNSYLTTVCRYLNKSKLFHVLYHVQVFMKDFVRAAMLCIKFYQEGASSYSDLNDRLHHVSHAHDHMKAMLDDKEWGSVQRGTNNSPRSSPGWGSGTKEGEVNVRLTWSPSELTKHINTILVQIDVTKFLHKALSTKGTPPKPTGASAGASSQAVKLPTLFGGGKEKAEVAYRVLMSGNSVSDGFDLAYRIIQDFRLPDILIYTRAARHLASLGKTGEIEKLLSMMRGLVKQEDYDEVVINCIRVMSGNPALLKEAESLIKLINSDWQKINAHIVCGKLKKAYLLAVRGERGVEDVKRIASAAERTGNTKIKDMCDQWLKKKEAEVPRRPDVQEYQRKQGRQWDQR